MPYPVLDPVCGMTVDPARAAGHVEHKGTTYSFCSKGCVAKFSADPEKYLSGTRESHPPAPAPMLQIGGLKKIASPPHSEPSTQHPGPSTQYPGPSTQHPEPSTIYTCPMHPEIRSPKPGACPKCGMALEPLITDVTAMTDEVPNPELVDMTRRFWVGVALGAPVFVLTMGDMLTAGALGDRVGAAWVNWI